MKNADKKYELASVTVYREKDRTRGSVHINHDRIRSIPNRSAIWVPLIRGTATVLHQALDIDMEHFFGIDVANQLRAKVKKLLGRALKAKAVTSRGAGPAKVEHYYTVTLSAEEYVELAVLCGKRKGKKREQQN